MAQEIENKEEVVTEEATGEEAAKEKTAEELKAEAEELENKIKSLKSQGKEEELRQNYQRRVDKAKAKLAELEPSDDGESEQAAPKEEVDTRDLIALAKVDIPEDSEKALILKKYKAGGLIKSYAEGLSHPGVKAEFDALDAKATAASVIDESGSDEAKLRSTKEVISSYRSTGEVPSDKKAIEAIAKENLKDMGLL